MRVRADRDLRQVRDSNDLFVPSEQREFLADPARGLASDVRVDLVEHQDRDLVDRSQHGFDSQHHARHFAAAGDVTKRDHRNARIR